ncbi:hypothetical protein Chor_008137 [Crotalus horridus]
MGALEVRSTLNGETSASHWRILPKQNRKPLESGKGNRSRLALERTYIPDIAQSYPENTLAKGTLADLECPSGWSSYDRYCYKPFKQEMTWADAEPCSSISYENLVDPFECFMVSRGTSRRNWLNVDCRQQLSFMCKFTRPR